MIAERFIRAAEPIGAARARNRRLRLIVKRLKMRQRFARFIEKPQRQPTGKKFRLQPVFTFIFSVTDRQAIGAVA